MPGVRLRPGAHIPNHQRLRRPLEANVYRVGAVPLSVSTLSPAFPSICIVEVQAPSKRLGLAHPTRRARGMKSSERRLKLILTPWGGEHTVDITRRGDSCV